LEPLFINGRPTKVPELVLRSVSELLDYLGVSPEGVAVEINGTVIFPEAFEGTSLTPESQVEIVTFVGGG
jgi:thiamine biosynthesis protein ThiS